MTGWPDTVAFIVMLIVALIMFGVYQTGRWPWEKR